MKTGSEVREWGETYRSDLLTEQQKVSALHQHERTNAAETNFRTFSWTKTCDAFCRSPARPFVSIRVGRGELSCASAAGRVWICHHGVSWHRGEYGGSWATKRREMRGSLNTCAVVCLVKRKSIHSVSGFVPANRFKNEDFISGRVDLFSLTLFVTMPPFKPLMSY